MEVQEDPIEKMSTKDILAKLLVEVEDRVVKSQTVLEGERPASAATSSSDSSATPMATTQVRTRACRRLGWGEGQEC